MNLALFVTLQNYYRLTRHSVSSEICSIRIVYMVVIRLALCIHAPRGLLYLPYCQLFFLREFYPIKNEVNITLLTKRECVIQLCLRFFVF
jgi:hypothetical protein